MAGDDNSFSAAVLSSSVLPLLPPNIFPFDGTDDQQNPTLTTEIFVSNSVKILRRTASGPDWDYVVGVEGLKLDALVGCVT